MILQVMRNEQCAERLREARQVLGHIHQGDGQIPRRMQDRQAERAHQHDIAGRGRAVLPENDRPAQQPDSQEYRDTGMQQAQLLQIKEAASPRGHLPVDRSVEPPVLATEPAERPDQRHISNHVDHFTVHRGSAVGEFVVQRPAGGGQVKHGHDQNSGEHQQRAGHGQAHGHHESDRDQGGHAGRHHVPDEHVLQGEDGVRGSRDTTGQRSGHPFGEIARRVPGEMAKQVAAQIAGYGNEGVAGDPAGNPPQQVVRGDQRRQQQQAQPCIANAAVDVQPRRKRIHQKLHAVLRAHRATDRTKDGEPGWRHAKWAAFLCSERGAQKDAERND